jgi:myo-inositol 2-dehydrogenase/D-chiro-inositol 1-dehydrogenase
LFKICMIGCGWVANFGHGPAYRKYAAEHADVELTACCDTEESRVIRFREKFGFEKKYTDYRVMLEKESPDVVCLNVPVSQIALLSREILQAGFPLLLEKPAGANLTETKILKEVSEKCGVANMVAFNRRYMPLIKTFKKTIEKTIGLQGIESIDYYLSRYRRLEDNFEITAIHGIDTVRFLTEAEYQSVQFQYRAFPDRGNNVIDIHLYAHLDSGVTATLNFYPLCGAVMERMVVNSSDHTFLIEIPVWDSVDLPGKILVVEKNEVINTINLHHQRQQVEDFQRYGFYAEDAAFFNFLRGGEKAAPDISQVLGTAEIMECIRKKKNSYQAG